jgi:anti-anti-sigma regulatory factor
MSRSFAIEQAGDFTRADLGSILDLRAAQPLRDCLLAVLENGKPLRLEAAAVERVSTACIQVLLAGGAAFKEAGLGFRVQQPSETLVAALGDLGLGNWLEEWVDEDA